VAVVGGGFSGLSVAFLLLRQAAKEGVELDLSLWEAEPRCGGKLSTVARDGYRCETGPNGFLDNVPQTLELVDQLGLGQRLLRSSDAARKRYIYSRGELRPLPENPAAFLRSNLLTVGGRLRIAGEYLVPRKQGEKAEDETVAAFIRRRLGEEALQKLIDPMRVVALERNYGGLIRGMIAKQKEARRRGEKRSGGAGPGGTLMSFRNGLQEVIDALAQAVGSRIRTAAPVRSLSAPAGKDHSHFELTFADGEKVSAEAVILAVPSYEAAAILEGEAPQASALLRGIPYSAVSVVHCGYDGQDAGRRLDGFGFLIPRQEGRRILGSLWTSSIFENRAPGGKVLLTTMVGGARDGRTPLLDDESLQTVVDAELKATMGQNVPPEFNQISRWEKAIPQYLVGHESRLRDIEERTRALRGLFLVGNAYRGIGVNDCVKAAGGVVPEVIRHLTQ
jgi:oxygen-dependent protoporphyrinogen oxidase